MNPSSSSAADASGSGSGERNALARGLGQDDAKSRSAMVGLVVHAGEREGRRRRRAVGALWEAVVRGRGGG